jgi:hypothetical protein
MERRTNLEDAKKIMGQNYIGPEELKNIQKKVGVKLPYNIMDNVPSIQFSKDKLLGCKDEYILILGVPFYKDGTNLTLNKMREHLGCDPLEHEPCFYNQDWYVNEAFANSTILLLDWYLLRKEIVDKIGGFRKGFEGSQDYDLFLRVIADIDQRTIYHIPKILYHWRMIPGSTAETITNKSYAFDRGAKALQEYFENKKIKCEVGKVFNLPYYFSNYALDKGSLVTIIIKGNYNWQKVKRCIRTIIKEVTYKNIEIKVTKCLKHEEIIMKRPVMFCNRGEDINTTILNSAGKYILLVDGMTQFTKHSKIEELIKYASQEHIGLVGPLMTKNINFVHQAGVILFEKSYKYAFTNYSTKSMGYLCKLKLPNDYSTIGNDVVMFKKERYLMSQGLTNEMYNDFSQFIKFSLELGKKGLYNVIVPSCLVDFTDGNDVSGEFTNESYENIRISKDSFYNPNLSEKYLFMLDNEVRGGKQ